LALSIALPEDLVGAFCVFADFFVAGFEDPTGTALTDVEESLTIDCQSKPSLAGVSGGASGMGIVICVLQ
jgi:hypothetical protein